MLVNQGAEGFWGDELWFAELGSVHALAKLLHRQNVQAPKQGGLPLNKPMELVLQQSRQGDRERSEQHPCTRVVAGQVNSAVQGHHGFAGAG